MTKEIVLNCLTFYCRFHIMIRIVRNVFNIKACKQLFIMFHDLLLHINKFFYS